MSETQKVERHFDDEMLWQWHDGELNEREMTAAQNHLNRCASCRQRVEAMERLFSVMQKRHHSVQPTLAEQIQLRRALEQQFVPEEMPSVLVNASRRLVRWLAPAVAVLGILFVLLRDEAAPAAETLVSLLPETPESNLLLVTTDDELEQAMWEMASSRDETQE